MPGYVGVDLGRFFLTPTRALLLLLLFIAVLYSLEVVNRSRFDTYYRGYIVFPRNSAGISLTFFLFFSGMAAIQSTNVTESINGFVSERWFIGVVLLVIGYNLASKYAHRRIIELSLVASAAIVVLIGFLDYLLGYSFYSLLPLPAHPDISAGFYEIKERAGYIRMQSSMDNPMTFSAFLVLVIPLIILFLSRSKEFPIKAALAVLLGLIIIAIMFAFVRSAYLAVIVQLILLHKIINPKFRRMIYSALLILSAGGLIVKYDEAVSLYKNVVMQEDRRVLHSTLYRAALVESGLNKFHEHPIFGVGQNRFSKEVSGEYLGREILFVHHENLYLTMLVEAGFFSLMFFLTILAAVLIRLRKCRRYAYRDRDNYISSKAYEASIVGWIICSIFLDSLSFTQISIPFWILIGLSLGYCNRRCSVIYSAGYFCRNPEVPVR